MAAAYPLTWPAHIPRWSGDRQSGQFKTSLEGALNNVTKSLQAFGRDSGKPVSDIVLSSNYSLGVKRPADPGVAVWFTWEGISICIPVDRYASIEANLQAIFHVIEARRVELRHGTLALVRATFQGFQALPAPEERGWRAILGFAGLGADFMPTEEEIRSRYRQKAKDVMDSSNPKDRDAKIKELNIARDLALKEIIFHGRA